MTGLPRWLRFLLVAMLLLPLPTARPTAASETESLPAESRLPEQRPAEVRDGAFTTLVDEQVDAWTIGGGYVYYARSCVTAPDGSVSGPAYLKRRTLGRLSPFAIGRQTVTLFSVFCTPVTGYYGFSSLYADTTGVYYAAVVADQKRIERRILGDPTRPIVLANFIGSLATYSGIAVGPRYVYWMENVGPSDTRMGLADAVTANPATRKYMPLGNVAAGDIAHYRGFVFYSAGSNLHRVQNICPFFESGCVERPIVSAASSSLLFSETSTTQLLNVIQGSTVRRITSPIDCASPCSTTVLYTSPSTGGVSWIPTAFTMATNPANNFTSLFVKEYEKTSCASGGFSPSYCDARIVRQTGVNVDPIIRLGRPGFLGQQALTSNDVFGPLMNDEVSLIFRRLGTPSTAWLGGIIYNDIDRLSSTLFSAGSINRDLAWVNNMEVTQGVQNLAGVTGNVPLVANRPTVVRVWGNQALGRPVNAPEAILFGDRDGLPLEGSPLQAVAAPAQLATGAPAPDRGVLASGWAFALPNSWAEGTIRLTVEVDPRRTVTELNIGNNVLTTNATFIRKTAVCIVAMPVRVADVPRLNLSGGAGSVEGFWDMVSLFRRMWPTSDVRIYSQTSQIEELEVSVSIIPPRVTKYGPYEMPDDKDKILSAISMREDLTDDPDECDDAGAITYYLGLMGGPPNTVGLNGAARRNASVLFVTAPSAAETEPYLPPATGATPANVPRAGVTLGHELGHSAGRLHVNCPPSGPNAPKNPDTGYPLDGNPTLVCAIDAPGFVSTHGLDIGTMTVLSPTQAGDLMSYAHNSSPKKPRWPSKYTYEALFNAIQTRSLAGSSGLVIPTAVDPTTPVVVVSGVVTPSQSSGAIEPAVVLPAGPAGSKLQKRLAESSLPNASIYRLQLLDASGTVLASQPISPTEGEDSEGPSPQLSFRTVFAAPARTVEKVEVTDGVTVLASRPVGAATPTVSLQSPVAGTIVGDSLVVAWTANDSDPADYLVYTLQYSPDMGQHWQAIFTNVPAISPGGTYDFRLPVGELPGSAGETALVRLLASDGYHTGMATSAPFKVPNNPPTVAIAAPNGGQPIPAGTPVQLLGEANDAEDGKVSSLIWTVDGQPAGSGNIASIYGLTTGDHTAELTATDSLGLTTTASRTFRIDPLRIPTIGADLAPPLDGFCDDDGYFAANRIWLEPFAFSGTGRGVVNLVRQSNTLYACFNNLEVGTESVPPTAYLRLDTGANDAPVDYQFGIDRAGTPSTVQGGAHGAGVASALGNLTAQIRLSDGEAAWSAEMRIDIASLGGWQNLRRIYFAETGMSSGTETMTWPYKVSSFQPGLWAALNVAGADLAVGLDASAMTPHSGSTIVYTILVANIGPEIASSSILTLTLPSGATFAAMAAGGASCSTPTVGQVLCGLGDLVVGASHVISVTAQVTGFAGSSLLTRADVTSGVQDANPPNNSAVLNGSVFQTLSSGAIGAPPGPLDTPMNAFVPAAMKGGP